MVTGPPSKSQQIIRQAYEYFQNDLLPIPIAANGTKQPIAKYGKLQKRKIEYTDEVFDELWPDGRIAGIALLTGPCSDNLEVLDIDDPTIVPAFEASLPAEIYSKLVINCTPRGVQGGRHYWYRTTTPVTKKGIVAYQLYEDENGEEKRKAKIETTNYCIAPGSPPETHKTGGLYETVRGSMTSLPRLTDEERELLMRCAMAFTDFTPPPSKNEDNAPSRKSGIIATVGDDFNANASWEDILEPHGYTFVQVADHRWQVRRPGKDRGISLTVGDLSQNGNSLLINFSSSTPFEVYSPGAEGEKAKAGVYTKFGAYTLLNHKGNEEEHFKEAVADLRAKNYGPPPLTDVSLAERVVIYNEDNLKYCPAFKGDKWLEWDGQRYRRENTSAADTVVIQTIRTLPHDNPDDVSLHEFSAKSQTNAKIVAVRTRLQNLPEMQVKQDDLDNHKWLLNLQNGTYDMEAGTFRKHSKKDMLTKLAPFPYRKGERCPHFMRFMEEMTKDKDGKERPEFVDFFARFMAVTCLGVVKDHFFGVLYGDGGNGKGTIIHVMEQLLGEDFSHVVAANALISKKHVPHPTELAQFRGKRFTPIQEFDSNQRLDSALVKSLTGGDTMNARECHKDYLNFTPSHTIWLATNYLPEVDDDSDGFWRRVFLIPFDQKIDPQLVVDLKENLTEELPGIFNFILGGLEAWKASGKLEMPEAIRAATERYREESHSVITWIKARTDTSEDSTTTVQAAYDDYIQYCRDNDIDETYSKKKFGNVIVRRRIGTRERDNKSRYYRGFSLKPDRNSKAFDDMDASGEGDDS